MALFKSEKKMDDEFTGDIKSIKVLGSGCKTCHLQYEYVKEVIDKLKADAIVQYITDMQEIMKYGVMSMPVIVINEKVVSSGVLVKPKDIEKMLKDRR